MYTARRFKFFILTALMAFFPFAANAETIKILAIGNSFSEDAVEQDLHAICQSEGYEVVIGNLYIAACTIDKHYLNLVEKRPAYRFRKIDTSGRMVQTNNCRLQTALKNEKWDYIVFQQASEFSGLLDSYSKLPELIAGVRKIVGRNPIFAFHQTWAYAPGSKHAGFARYGKNQLSMYHAIVKTTKTIMERNPELKFIIPCGTAIQNARTAINVGDDLTRDGYHLDKQTGRYIASLTWIVAIFRHLVDTSCFKPAGVSRLEAEVAVDAATEAVLHPWRITTLRLVKE